MHKKLIGHFFKIGILSTLLCFSVTCSTLQPKTSPEPNIKVIKDEYTYIKNGSTIEGLRVDFQLANKSYIKAEGYYTIWGIHSDKHSKGVYYVSSCGIPVELKHKNQTDENFHLGKYFSLEPLEIGSYSCYIPQPSNKLQINTVYYEFFNVSGNYLEPYVQVLIDTIFGKYEQKRTETEDR
jgi:hypothetical protein